PVAAGDALTTQIGTVLTIPVTLLLGNDTDANGDPLTVTGVTSPLNGTVAFDAIAGTVTFTPAAGYIGAASFTYTISDGRGETSTADVEVTVTPPLTGSSLFAADATPAIVTVDDDQGVELGMKFEVA